LEVGPDPLKCIERRPLGAFGVALRGGTRPLGLPARASSDSPSYFAFVEQRLGECKTVAGESSEWLVDSLGIRRDDQSLLSSAFSRYRLPKRPQMLWLSSSARFAFARESSEVSPTI
jgi:hypothetical protein